MVRVCRTPKVGHFTANQLSGWPNGVQYTPLPTREEKRRRRREERREQRRQELEDFLMECVQVHRPASVHLSGQVCSQ